MCLLISMGFDDSENYFHFSRINFKKNKKSLY